LAIDSFAVQPPLCRGRSRFCLIREAVDRLLADEGVDPGVEVEGDKLAGGFGCGIHD
jgi:hypothetical protein